MREVSDWTMTLNVIRYINKHDKSYSVLTNHVSSV